MSRTFIRQDVQIASTLTSAVGFVDNVASGAAMESGAGTIADDLNNLRSQVNRVIDATVAGNWYDDAPTVNSKKRGLLQLNTDLDDVEEHRFLFRTQILTDVTVTAAQNWELLVVASSETPTQTAAVGAVTTEGAVVAAHGGTFDTHDLSEVAGPSALRPKNLLVIRDATTGQAIQSGGKDVWGLLQSESATDGHTFDDSTNRVQISFVIENAAGDDLIACPVADIAGSTINYAYVQRLKFDSLPESAFLSNHVFVDQSASVDVTRQNAYDNQGTTPVELATDADLDLAASVVWAIRDAANADLLSVTEGSSGGTSAVTVGADVDLYDNNAADVDFASGASINSGGTRPIDVGVNDGVIESTAGDLAVKATTELFLDDGNQPGSWAQTAGVKLSETATDWSTWETNFGGEVSIMEAMNATWAAAQSGGTRTKVQAVLTADVAADTDVNGPSYANNTDVDLAPFDAVPTSFVADVEIYLNGELLRNAANDGGGEDVYPGTSAAQGDLKFQFGLKGTGAKPDQLTVIVNGQ